MGYVHLGYVCWPLEAKSKGFLLKMSMFLRFKYPHTGFCAKKTTTPIFQVHFENRCRPRCPPIPKLDVTLVNEAGPRPHLVSDVASLLDNIEVGGLCVCVCGWVGGWVGVCVCVGGCVRASVRVSVCVCVRMWGWKLAPWS